MITNFKIFETLYRTPKIGDYVLFPKEIITGDSGDIEYYIGQIFHRHSNGYWVNNIENIERDIFINFLMLEKCKYSENKEELEIYQNTKKYNL